MIQILEICECLLCSSFAAINSTKNNFKKYPKESLRKVVQENSCYAKKCVVFCILGFLCVHACAENVNGELLENFYFSPSIVLENSWDLNTKILHRPFLYQAHDRDLVCSNEIIVAFIVFTEHSPSSWIIFYRKFHPFLHFQEVKAYREESMQEESRYHYIQAMIKVHLYSMLLFCYRSIVLYVRDCLMFEICFSSFLLAARYAIMVSLQLFIICLQ